MRVNPEPNRRGPNLFWMAIGGGLSVLGLITGWAWVMVVGMILALGGIIVEMILDYTGHLDD